MPVGKTYLRGSDAKLAGAHLLSVAAQHGRNATQMRCQGRECFGPFKRRVMKL
jgi:hypothetical protein